MPSSGSQETAKREINRKIARARELGPDITRIAGTSLDKGVEAAHIARRKAIWEEINSGKSFPTIPAERGRPKEFAAELAETARQSLATSLSDGRKPEWGAVT